MALQPRRQPKQDRSRATVEAVLDAVTRVLARSGMAAVTTNRIAEMAGVSIGSVYQYFPDKQAIFDALHERHVERIGRRIERTLADHTKSSLEEFVIALLEALVDAHAEEPELHEVLSTQIPRSDGGRSLETRIRNVLRLAVASRTSQTPRDLDLTVFVLANMIESLAHGVVARRPARLSIGAAKEEAVRAVLAYLNAPALARPGRNR